MGLQTTRCDSARRYTGVPTADTSTHLTLQLANYGSSSEGLATVGNERLEDAEGTAGPNKAAGRTPLAVGWAAVETLQGRRGDQPIGQVR